MLMRGSAILVAIIIVGLLAAPASADAFGDADCGEHPYPGCQVHAGRDGQPSVSTPSVGPRVADGAAGRGGGAQTQTPPGDRSLDKPVTSCAYVRSDYQPPTESPRPVLYRQHAGGELMVRPALFRGSTSVVAVAVPGGGPGAWYLYRCATPGDSGDESLLYRAPVWIADAAPGVAAAPDPNALAEQARSQLRLAGPRIDMNPVGDQLLGLPTWLWLDPAGWGQVSATAAAGGVSVTAVARPVSVVWSLGDGGSVTCTGPGTPFPAGADPSSASPTCGYTYRHPSLTAPGGRWAVTATVRWDVTWAGAGRAGAFAGLTTVSTTTARVIDVPALTTGGG